LVEDLADEEIVRAEIVPPHAHAVNLVDHDQPDPDLPEHLDERPLAQPLGCGVQKPCPSGAHAFETCGRLRRVERRVDERRLLGDRGRQLVELILHQRDQRREDECGGRAQHRSELIRQGLSRARRHQRQQVAALDRRPDD
jgi:hypothetical protein